MKSKLVQGLALGLASAVTVLPGWRLGWFDALENRSLDWRFRTLTRVTHPSDIVIIAVDDQSFDSPGFVQDFGRFPPRRLLYGGLVHYLHEWGARAIAFDVIFQGSDPHPGDDERFSEALGERKDVVLGFTLNDANLDAPVRKSLQERLAPFGIKVDDRAPVQLSPYTGADVPLGSLMKQAAALGCATVQPDDDGTVRRVSPVMRFEGHDYPSLSLAIAELASGIPESQPLEVAPGPRLLVGGRRVPLDARGRMVIDWYGPAYHTFPIYSVWKVFNAALAYENKAKPDLPPQIFKNKIVLIAVTAVGAGDLRPTPFSRVQPGVEIQATLVENFLHGNFLRTAKPRVAVAGVMLMALGMAGIVYSFDSAAIYSLLALAGGAFYVGMACWFFRAQSLWVPMVAPLAGGGLGFVSATLTRYATEGREKRQYRKTLMKYLSPSLVETIMADLDWASLRAEKKTLTVLFSDVRGFTTFSEKYPPETVIATLNEHLNMMVSVIFKHQGTLDKFVGDCVMAFWGAPLQQPNHAELAARASLEMIQGLEKLNEKWQSEGRPTLHIGVGVNTGEMLFGNIGSEQRMDFTVIGDSVNLGARLESSTKELQASIVISEATYREIRDLAEVRPLGEIHVKGKEQGIVVYELLGMAGQAGSRSEVKGVAS